jgi:membrane protease YdiL (CAAX protease family)
VSAEFWAESGRLIVAGGIVAAVVLPFGMITGAVVRRRRVALLPSWKPWRVPWGGFEVCVFFAAVVLIPDLLRQAGVEQLTAGVLALPFQIALLALAWRALYPRWKPFRRDVAAFKSEEITLEHPLPVGRAFARAMTLAIIAWMFLSPLVHLMNGIVRVVFTRFNLPVDEHPLTHLGGGTGWEQVLFLTQACVAAPIIEELLFRGVLLSWIAGARERHTGGLVVRPVIPPRLRPLAVMVVTVAYAYLAGTRADGNRVYGPVLFAVLLTVGLLVLWAVVRRGGRHARAVYSSAAFFAIVHSAVWPSPVALFVLGLGLGWLAVRTRGVLVPMVVHGLFNAVSAVYVLRGAT